MYIATGEIKKDIVKRKENVGLKADSNRGLETIHILESQFLTMH